MNSVLSLIGRDKELFYSYVQNSEAKLTEIVS